MDQVSEKQGKKETKRHYGGQKGESRLSHLKLNSRMQEEDGMTMKLRYIVFLYKQPVHRYAVGCGRAYQTIIHAVSEYQYR